MLKIEGNIVISRQQINLMMTKYRLVIVMLVAMFPLLSQGQGIKFEEKSWSEIVSKAQKENKLIFLDAYASWCGPCKWMAKEVFPKEEVGKFYNENFICAKIDMEKGEGVDLAKKYKVRAYPSLFYILPTGEVAYKVLGAREAEDFISAGKNALDPEKRIGRLAERYESGERSTKFMAAYLSTLDEAGEETSDIAADFLENSSEDELLDQDGAELLVSYLPSVEHSSFQFLKSHKGKVEELVGAEKVDQKLYSLYEGSYRSLATRGEEGYTIDMKAFEDAVNVIKASGYDRANELEVKAYMFYYQVTKDTEKYAMSVATYVDRFPPSGWQEYNQYAWYFYENVDDKELLNRAAKWAEKSIAIDDNYYNEDTYAALLLKLGKYSEAEKAAQKAIDFAKEAGEEYTATEELLKKARDAKK